MKYHDNKDEGGEDEDPKFMRSFLKAGKKIVSLLRINMAMHFIWGDEEMATYHPGKSPKSPDMGVKSHSKTVFSFVEIQGF